MIKKRQPTEEDISLRSPSPIFKKRKFTITTRNDKPVSKLSPIQPQKVRPKSTRVKIPRKCIACLSLDCQSKCPKLMARKTTLSAGKSKTIQPYPIVYITKYLISEFFDRTYHYSVKRSLQSETTPNPHFC